MDKVKAKSERRLRNVVDRVLPITSFVAVLLLLVSAVGGCGKSDVGTGGESSGNPDGGTGTSTTQKSEQADTLVVKGLYVGMQGDDAVEACKKLAASSGDLVAVDFRNGIEREKDEAMKAKERKAFDEQVGKAESDVDRFLKWNSLHADTYDPSASERNYKGKSVSAQPFLGGVNAKVPIPSVHSIASAMATLAGMHGYQVEWMIPGKRKGEKQKEGSAPKLFSGKVGIPETRRDSSQYSFWKSEIFDKGLINELYAKGMQLSKGNEKRAFFRLVLEDAQGNPVEKKKLAEELVINNPEYFTELNTKEEKVEAAEKEVEGFLNWVEFHDGKISVFDPEDPRAEEDKERADSEAKAMAEMAKRGDVKGMEKMKVAMNGKGGNPAGMKGNDVSADQSSGETAKVSKMKAQLSKMEKRKSSLDTEIANLKKSLKSLMESGKRLYEQAKRNPALRKDPTFKERFAKNKEQLAATKEKYEAAKEKRENEVAAIEEMKKKIESKEAKVKTEVAARGNATSEKKTKKNRTDLKFLTAARTGRNGNTTGDYAVAFSKAMMKMACNCKVMLEWGVLTEPVDGLVTITETIVIPTNTYDGVYKFMQKLDSDLGEGIAVAGENLRKRLFFEKDLVNVGSPLWFRLVLKTTNGVEVAKEEVVKNWLEARGHYPPSTKLKIAKKNLIEVAIKKEGAREDELKGLCFVWIDDQDKVKEVYFNEDGMARLFNAGDLSSEKFAQALVDKYPGISSLEPSVQRLNPWKEPGRGYIQETTWIHNNPKGYQVKLYECAYIDSIRGKKFTSDKKLFDTDMQLSLALSQTKKRFRKYLSISVSKSDSARKFD